MLPIARNRKRLSSSRFGSNQSSMATLLLGFHSFWKQWLIGVTLSWHQSRSGKLGPGRNVATWSTLAFKMLGRGSSALKATKKTRPLPALDSFRHHHSCIPKQTRNNHWPQTQTWNPQCCSLMQDQQSRSPLALHSCAKWKSRDLTTIQIQFKCSCPSEGS